MFQANFEKVWHGMGGAGYAGIMLATVDGTHSHSQSHCTEDEDEDDNATRIFTSKREDSRRQQNERVRM